MRRPKEQDDPKGIVILRVGEVCQRMSVSVSYVYGLIAHQLFPQFVPIGPKSCGLPEHVSRRCSGPGCLSAPGRAPERPGRRIG